mmetsp:Transcript_3738/g.6611  ORF Transcript_3738/g.6611 Transcript_3738/m.6611 type:complete len:284 (-) Transcript_3738:583-1434(-)
MTACFLPILKKKSSTRAFIFYKKLLRFIYHETPDFFHVLHCAHQVATNKSQDHRTIQLGADEKCLACGIDIVEQLSVQFVGSLKSKANEAQIMWSRHFEAIVRQYSISKGIAHADALADVRSKLLGAVHAKSRPQLQRSEPPTEGHLPVPVVRHESLIMLLAAQIRGCDREGLHHGRPILDPHGAEVEVHQHPLVRVECHAVGELQALEHVLVFRANGSRARVRSVDVEVNVVLLTDRSNLIDGIHGTRVGSTCVGAHEYRHKSLRLVLRNACSQHLPGSGIS